MTGVTHHLNPYNDWPSQLRTIYNPPDLPQSRFTQVQIIYIMESRRDYGPSGAIYQHWRNMGVYFPGISAESGYRSQKRRYQL
jgi:hypothetical protein